MPRGKRKDGDEHGDDHDHGRDHDGDHDGDEDGGYGSGQRRPRRRRPMDAAGVVEQEDTEAVSSNKQEMRFWAWEGGFQLLLALCGPSMLLMISEWWGFEALAIMAGG
jgi:hypothetical protein